jgi:hypothetical protein
MELWKVIEGGRNVWKDVSIGVVGDASSGQEENIWRGMIVTCCMWCISETVQ